MSKSRVLGYAAQFVPGSDIAHAAYMSTRDGGSVDEHYGKTKSAKAGGSARGAINGAIIGGLMGAGAGVMNAASNMKRHKGAGRVAMKDAKKQALKVGLVSAAVGAIGGNIIGGAKSNANHYQRTLDRVRHDSNDSVNVKEASGHALLQKLPLDSRIGPNPPSPADKIWQQQRRVRTIKNG